MFVNNILSNWEWNLYVSKLKYVLWQLYFAQILAGEGAGEKNIIFEFSINSRWTYEFPVERQ